MVDPVAGAVPVPGPRAGDREPVGGVGAADRAIVTALYPSLRRFAAVVGPIEVDPDDLVQEALYRSLRIAPLTSLDDPGAYVRRSIVRLAANERRRLGRRRLAMARLASRDHGGGTGDAYPSDLSDLLRLEPEDRAVLWLAEVEGASYAEVAAVLGCTEGAARTKASRARRRLRDAMGEDQ
jgi:DNA-directed RNA polymerase specialized sigma24 family protein